MSANIHFVEFIHIMFGTIFFGITIADFFYIANSVKQKEAGLIYCALKASFYADGLALFAILVQYFTATILVKHFNLSMVVPWIFVAYLAFTVIVFLWVMNVIIKCFNMKHLKTRQGEFTFKRLFYCSHILMVAIFILIIHDAVMHRTYFTALHL